jgi:hypothetical protein
MSISIPHRFIDRLLPEDNLSVKTVIIGTFNPGEPEISNISQQQKQHLGIIFSSKKHLHFREVKNFYDHPQNRFWGVMDRIANPEIYEKHGLGHKNLEGLKYFTGMNRDVVFKRQLQFCQKHGLLISDLVREVNTSEFEKVYNNFQDVDIDPFVSSWNTNALIELIQKNHAIRVIFNVNESSSIPVISQQIQIIKSTAPQNIFRVSSTSGAAGYTYEHLIPEWKMALNI